MFKVKVKEIKIGELHIKKNRDFKYLKLAEMLGISIDSDDFKYGVAVGMKLRAEK